jgi:hypothetical protein
MLGKSAARLYKESGTTLTFKEWINREKTKYLSANGEDNSLVMIDRNLNDSVQNAIKEAFGNTSDKKTGSFQINKAWLIGGALVIIAAAATYYLITKKKT